MATLTDLAGTEGAVAGFMTAWNTYKQNPTEENFSAVLNQAAGALGAFVSFVIG